MRGVQARCGRAGWSSDAPSVGCWLLQCSLDSLSSRTSPRYYGQRAGQHHRAAPPRQAPAPASPPSEKDLGAEATLLLARRPASRGRRGVTCCASFLLQLRSTWLELAFCDRKSFWNEMAKTSGCKIYKTPNDDLHSDPCGYTRYFQPTGFFPFYKPTANGPDLKGEDRLIKSPQQFNECIADVITQLTSLETFVWCTLLAALPIRACSALASLTSLTSLRLTFDSSRGTCHAGEPQENAVRLTMLNAQR